jgi:twitching motility protein PilT
MIDQINSDRHDHIVTIEDPIEFLHPHKNCIVNPREVSSDTKSFKNALKYILRQDPDVVLIGEMRDLETIEAALSISETGHLTFATLHTNSALQSINRIIDVFPPHQQSQVRAQLSFVLEGVLSQQLIPKTNGRGRAMSIEVMIPTPAIRNLIREDKVHQIYSSMQTGQGKHGMQTMNQSLFDLCSKHHISHEDAIGRSSQPDELITMLNRGGTPMPGMREPGRMVRR